MLDRVGSNGCTPGRVWRGLPEPRTRDVQNLSRDGRSDLGAERELNSFFLSLNIGITSLMGDVALGRDEAADSPWVAMVMIAGIVVSYLWYRIVRSYRDLNSAKFRVIHEIETLLAVHPCRDFRPVDIHGSTLHCPGARRTGDLHLNQLSASPFRVLATVLNCTGNSVSS